MIRIYLKRTFGYVALLFGILLSGWFIYNQIWPTESFKTGFKSIFQLIFPIALLVTGWKAIKYKGKGIEEVIPPDLVCEQLESSQDKARKTIDEFITEVEKGIDGAFIKFSLKNSKEQTEHMWGYVHFYKDNHFNVSLANAPIDPQLENEGRRNIALDRIEDWQIVYPDGSIDGTFSLIALFEFWESQGKPLSPLMKEQKLQLRRLANCSFDRELSINATTEKETKAS